MCENVVINEKNCQRFSVKVPILSIQSPDYRTYYNVSTWITCCRLLFIKMYLYCQTYAFFPQLLGNLFKTGFSCDAVHVLMKKCMEIPKL